MFAYSYFGGETTARQSAAWNSYNEAVEGMAAESRSAPRVGRRVSRFADAAICRHHLGRWPAGDGLAVLTSRIARRRWKRVNRAIGAYQSLLRETEDERIESRAHFGLGRVYELQNELDKARDGIPQPSRADSQAARRGAGQATRKARHQGRVRLAGDRRRPAPHVARRPRHARPAARLRAGRDRAARGEHTRPKNPAPTISVDDLFKGIGETGNKDESNSPIATTKATPGGESLPTDTPETERRDGRCPADGAKPDDAQPKE